MTTNEPEQKLPYSIRYTVVDMSGILYALQKMYNEEYNIERDKAVAAAKSALTNQPDILDTASDEQLLASHDAMVKTLLRVM